MQIDKGGCTAGKNTGCVDNLLIEKMVLEDAHLQKKKYPAVWWTRRQRLIRYPPNEY